MVGIQLQEHFFRKDDIDDGEYDKVDFCDKNVLV